MFKRLLLLIAIVMPNLSWAQTTVVAPATTAPPATTTTTATTVTQVPVTALPSAVPVTSYTPNAIPSIVSETTTRGYTVTNPNCPPASDYQVAAGYRLAGISPSCIGVPVPMFEPWP